jgi:mono/diheme cytochrome c family protein
MRPRILPGWRSGCAAIGAIAVAAALVFWLNVRGEDAIDPEQGDHASTPEQVSRGAYLARAGNCTACHTDRGGRPFAGGKGIPTPFGTVYASNLTPDLKTGIGSWSPAHFWRAMHHGRSKDGRLLYPAFPYPSFTLITREDSDALYAFLRSQAPVQQPNRPHELRWPYDLQVALAVWRALFFSPMAFAVQADQSTEWNRGAYLVRGLGHCDACHAARNVFGATRSALELSGGLIAMQNWYAPSLADPGEAGVADWPTEDVVSLLGSGTSKRGTVMGPMAEVVFRSTQHLSDADLGAMAIYLKSLPHRSPAPAASKKATPEALELGQRIYAQQCAMCHGERGQGRGPYPPLARHRTVTMGPHTNLVRVILSGGFPPTTTGNPRPYGMPSLALNDEEIAAVASYVRGAWGNAAPAVSALDVMRVH